MIDLGTLIHDALERNASDIHLTVGEPPVFRLDGELTNFGEVPLTEADTTAYVQELITPGLLKEFQEMGEADFAVTYHDLVRMRCNVFRQRGMTSLALRLLPLRIATAEELGLPPVVVAQADKPRGLVLVTGPTGSGKSSTLAALLDHINHTERRHIITLEEPIEYLHTSDQCIINQREVGADTSSFAAGLRAALRQDPDVILVGEMRDLETISTAITAAETGHLVFGTLHTKGAANTIDRIIDACPAGAQNQVRSQLSGVLAGVITQCLIPTADGLGRCAATEVLVGTDAVLNMVRESKIYQLDTVMQSNRALGMHTLNADLMAKVRAGVITAQSALEYSNDRRELTELLG